MPENQERRRARRQKRGLLRFGEILQVAGGLFAEVGYDRTTTIAIATRAGLSPGSLYQFFPNKEAIAREFAMYAAGQLYQVYEAVLAPEVISLPLRAFLDTFIDGLITFNQRYPGYLALSLGATVSSSLEKALTELQQEAMARLDMVFARRWPKSTPAERSLAILVTYRIFLALLPLILQKEGEEQQDLVREMKTALYRYLEPGVGTPATSARPAATGE